MAIGSGDLLGVSFLVEKSFSGALVISSGASGDLISINPGADFYAKLTGLSSNLETGITVTSGARVIVTSKTLRLTTDVAGGFTVGSGEVNAARAHTSTIIEILGKKGEIMVVSKDTGSTVGDVNYGFAIMEEA